MMPGRDDGGGNAELVAALALCGWAERMRLAASNSTPTEVLAVLGRDRSEDVRMLVAHNENSPPEYRGPGGLLGREYDRGLE